MTVPRSATGEDSGGSHQPRFRGATDRKYGRHALQCNKESAPGDVAEMLRLRAGAEGRMVKIGGRPPFAHSRLEPLHALLRGAAPQQMCRSATCPEWGQFSRRRPTRGPAGLTMAGLPPPTDMPVARLATARTDLCGLRLASAFNSSV